MDKKTVIKAPQMSTYYANKKPSGVRMAHLKYEKRTDDVALVNGAIGNVSLPMHPKMIERLHQVGQPGSGFEEGVVKYAETSGHPETKAAFLNTIKQAGFDTSDLNVLVTDGGSLAMEIALLGIAGAPGGEDKPLMMFDPAYTNYNSLAQRIGRQTVTISRQLSDDGHFTFPEPAEMEAFIQKEQPGAILVIPYDNPTGQMMDGEMLKTIAALCVKYNLWLLSDEAYRGLFYHDDREMVSIWGLTDEDVSGIEGRRLSIETTSKIWNACGLRIGALISDNDQFYTQAVAEYTNNLCANSIGQYIFGAIAHETQEDLDAWMTQQRTYYKNISQRMYVAFKEINPDYIVSQPEASIYLVVDVRKVVQPAFNSEDFVSFCAEKGSVLLNGVPTTLLLTTMPGFYKTVPGQKNPGMTQIRISFCETMEKLHQIPLLFQKLLEQYEETRNK